MVRGGGHGVLPGIHNLPQPQTSGDNSAKYLLEQSKHIKIKKKYSKLFQSSKIQNYEKYSENIKIKKQHFH